MPLASPRPAAPRAAAALLVAACALLAACDFPAAPPPTPDNPYDPLHGDGRVPTPPDGLALTAATPTTVTLGWTDRSSFESGFRVERSAFGRNGYAAFAVVGEVGPDATSFTDTPPTDAPHRYRVTPFAGDEVGAPSDTLTVAYPATTLRRTASPQDVDFSDDGRVLALNEGRTTVLYDAVTLQRTASVSDGNDLQGSVELSPDGSLLALGDVVPFTSGATVLRSVRLYHTSNGTRYRELVVPGDATTGFGTYIAQSIAFSPDGGRLATVGGPYGIRLWDVATGQVLRTFGAAELGNSPHTSESRAVRFLPGSRLITYIRTSYRADLMLWDGGTGTLLRTYTGIDFSRLHAYSVSPDGGTLTLVISSGFALEFRTLDVSTGATLDTYTVPDVLSSDVTGIAFTPAGQRIAILVRDPQPGTRRIVVYDLRTRTVERGLTVDHVFETQVSASIGGATWSPDGRTLVATLLNLTGLRVWQLDDVWTTAEAPRP